MKLPMELFFKLIINIIVINDHNLIRYIETTCVQNFFTQCVSQSRTTCTGKLLIGLSRTISENISLGLIKSTLNSHNSIKF